jgi:long-chain fatty acid transport protein
MKKIGIAFLLAFACSTGAAFGAGLAIAEQGAAAMGLSSAVTARSQDLSAIYYNPAGLEYVQKGEAYLGLTPIRPNHSFEAKGISNETVSKTYLPPQAYFAYRMHPRLVFGMGVYSPYGLGTDWGDKWVGRYTSTYAEVQSLYINPSASVKIADWMDRGIKKHDDAATIDAVRKEVEETCAKFPPPGIPVG